MRFGMLAVGDVVHNQNAVKDVVKNPLRDPVEDAVTMEVSR
ncbi:hypothetical protein AB0K60_00565 [Thermopolyspora sp. NPDC052614]